MGHLQQFEEGLRERLPEGVSEDAIAWIKEQVLKSYRNGLAMRRAGGKDGEQAVRNFKHPIKK